MRPSILLLAALFALPALAQQEDVVLDPATHEPVPLATEAPPALADLPPDNREALTLLKHLPEGSTKAARFLPTEPHAAIIQNGAAVVTFTWGLPSGGDLRSENAPELDRYVLEFQPSDIFVRDDGIVFVSSRGGGVKILDALLPTAMVPRGFTAPFDALAVVVQGDVAYVGAGFGGVRIFDVSNLDEPLQIGSFNTGGSANGLHIEGDLLFVANGNPAGVDNFRIYDVSDPDDVQLVGGFNPDGFVTNVAVQGDHAFLTGAAGLVVLDIIDPSSPAQVGSFAAGGQTTFDVATFDHRLSIAGLAGFWVLDISTPADPTPMFSLPAGQGMATDIGFIEGFHTVIFGDRFDGALTNIWHEGAYATISFYRNGGFSHKAAFRGNRLFVTDLAGALRILNVDEPEVAFQISRLEMPSNTQWVHVRENTAYVADADFGGTGLTIVDVSSSLNPEIIGGWGSANQAFGLDLDGDVLYLANGFGGLTSIDVADPEEPETISSLPFGSNIVDVAVRDDVAFVTSFGAGLVSVDVSDPADMEIISAQSVWGFLNAIDLVPADWMPGIAYVADGQHGLRVVDVSDPGNMSTLHTGATAFPARDVAAGVGFFEDYYEPVAYVADDFFGLRVFSADAESLASFRTADRGIGVAARDGDGAPDLVAVASGETGVYLFQGPAFIAAEPGPIDGALALDAVYPNPVRGAATVSYRLAEPGSARLEVFDILGRRVMELASGTHEAGAHELTLEAGTLPAGIYVVRLTAAGETATRRVTIVR